MLCGSAMESTRRIFVAGATGKVGRTLVRRADARDVQVVPHFRPKTAAQGAQHPRAVVLELSDLEALSAALADCTTVLQLIGTVRKRFGAGDTYETSDIGTTQQLVDAAKKSGKVDHFVLLSSVGAGKPVGAYLKAKARAEAIVRDSGLPFTIVRPSAFVGEGAQRIPGMDTVTKLLGLKSLQPIRLEDVAAVMLDVGVRRAHVGEVLEGESLWSAVPEANQG